MWAVWLAALLGFSMRARFTQHLLSQAVGAWLATAFMHLLLEAFESQASAKKLFVLLLNGLVFFFLLDTVQLWQRRYEHHQPESYADHSHPEHP